MSYQQEEFRKIADKIREKTGTTDLIIPNEFASKIEDVYNKGFSEGANSLPDVDSMEFPLAGGNFGRVATNSSIYNEIATALIRVGYTKKIYPHAMADAVREAASAVYDDGCSEGEAQGRTALETELLGGAW